MYIHIYREIYIHMYICMSVCIYDLYVNGICIPVYVHTGRPGDRESLGLT